MKDRTPKYPGRIKLVPVDVANGIYDMVRADEPTQPGDPLCKNTLLRDETAELFGLDASATIADVLDKIIKGFAMKGDFSIEKSFPVLKLINTVSERHAECNMGSDKYTSLYNRKDKDNYQGFYIPPETASAIMQLVQCVNGKRSVFNVLHTGNLEALNSARIVTGSYTGTGTIGSNNPNTLTFSFNPKVILIYEDLDTAMWLIRHPSTTEAVVLRNDMTYVYSMGAGVRGTFSDNSISWYTANELPGCQGNKNGVEYVYVAIG